MLGRLALITFAAATAGCYAEHGPAPDAPPSIEADAGRTSDPTPPPGRDAGPPDGGPVDLDPPDAIDGCAAAHASLLARCGELPTVHVRPGASPGGRGAPDDPFSGLDLALDHCRGGCVVRLAEGSYELDGALELPRCTWLSGGWIPAPGAWAPTGGRSTLATGHATIDAPHGHVLLERLWIVSWGTSLSASGDALTVRDVVFRGENGATLDGVRGARVCGAAVTAGYAGIRVSESEGVLLDGVTIEAGYEGVRVTEGSSVVEIRDSSVGAEYEAVVVTRGASQVRVSDSAVSGRYVGISVSRDAHHVVVRDSDVRGCYEAVSVGAGARDVSVDSSNTLRGC